MKKCSKCEISKAKTKFYRDSRYKDGHQSYCIPCLDKYRKEWLVNNKEKRHKYIVEYRSKNRERINGLARKRNQTDPTKSRSYRKKHILRHGDVYRKMRAEYMRNKRRDDLNFNIAFKLRVRMRAALKDNPKKSGMLGLLGCSLAEFREHIESRFTEGMTWQKFFRGEIHLDHIRPCSSFNLSDQEQQYQCFNYKNIQPLWAKDNLVKNNKYMNTHT